MTYSSVQKWPLDAEGSRRRPNLDQRRMANPWNRSSQSDARSAGRLLSGRDSRSGHSAWPIQVWRPPIGDPVLDKTDPEPTSVGSGSENLRVASSVGIDPCPAGSTH